MKKISLILISLLIIGGVFSRVEAQNYDSLVNEISQYINLNEMDTTEGGDASEIAKTLKFYRDRLDVNGNIDTYLQGLGQTENKQGGLFDNLHWEYIGHNNEYHPSGYTEHNRIVEIWVDPDNAQHILAGTYKNGLWETYDQGDTWVCISNTEPNGMIKGIASIEVIDGVIYVASVEGGRAGYSLGLFYTADDGATWNEQKVTVGNQDIFPSSSWKNTIYCWRHHPTNSNYQFVLTSNRLFRSNDGGLTFELMFFKEPHYAQDTIYSPWHDNNVMKKLLFNPNNTNELFISGPELLKINIDDPAGDEPENLTPNLDPGADFDVYATDMGASKINPNIIWFMSMTNNIYTYLDKKAGKIAMIKYDDNTGIYEIHDAEFQTGIYIATHQLEVSPFNDNHIYVGMIFHRFYNFEGGFSKFDLGWEMHHDVRAAQLVNENGHLVLIEGNDGGIGKASFPGTDPDSGTDLVSITNDGTDGIINYDMWSFDVSPDTEHDMMLMACSDNGTIVNRDDDWFTFYGSVADGMFCQFSKTDYHVAYSSFGDVNGIIQTDPITSSTGSYNNVYSFNTQGNMDYQSFLISPNNANIIYTGEKDKVVRVNTSGNNTILNIEDPSSASTVIPNTFAARGNENSLYIATNGGKSDTKINKPVLFQLEDNDGDISIVKDMTDAILTNMPNWTRITSLTVDDSNPDRFWVSISGSGNQDKIFVTTDNGDTFTPLTSNGLNNFFPVSEILYDNKTHRLFATNDDAIFWYDEHIGQSSDPEWVDITGDLPPIFCNYIRFNSRHDHLRLGSRGRGPWEASLCFYDGENPIHITDNTTWDYIQYIGNDIIVEDGAVLTITETVFMASEAKITVEPGGKLLLNGGTLTNLCPERWQGVEVRGNQISSNPNDQGQLVINGGTIENAIVGVRNYFADEMLHYGGIIQATNANFINNQTAVQLKDTHYDLSNNYYSFFDHCDFEVNEDYPGASNFKVFADLSRVNDIIIHHCDFKNAMPFYQGTGILAKEAGFTVNAGSSFEKIKYAIQNYGSGSSMGSVIENSTFTDNYRGIYVGGVNDMQITGDTIKVPYPMVGGPYSHGVYLEKCDGYVVEDNVFSSYIAEEPGFVGLYIKNSGGNDNQVYNNQFTDLSYGAIAYGENRSHHEGLCFKCNDFTNNDYDIAVYGDKPKDGIKDNQGSDAPEATAPAGNRFSNTGNSVGLDNQGTHFTYYYPIYTEVPDVIPLDYTYETVTLYPNTFGQWTIEEGCPESGSGGGGGGISTGAERSAMVENEAKSDSVQLILDYLVDGGDTQGTTQNVETSYPPETYSVYNDLMNKSPYLSDEVVKASIEKEDVLPNVMIRDIMVANPQSAKEKELMDKVDERANPMPDYMKAQILAGKNLVGYMEKLEAEKEHYAQKRARAYHNLIRIYQQDSLLTTDAKLDSLIALVSNENTIPAQYRLAMLYFAKEDYSAGQNVLSAIPNTFNLDAEQTSEHGYFTDYYQIATDLAVSGDSLTAQQIADLEYIMNEDAGLSAAYARNLLIANDVLDYVEEVTVPQSLNFAAGPQEEDLQQTLEEHTYLSLYPNPAKDYIIVSYELEMEYADAQLQIYDSKGSLVQSIPAKHIQDQKVIPTTGLKTGTYVIRLFFNGREMESQKFNVIK